MNSASSLDDDDEEFAWFQPRDAYVLQPRIDHMVKWSDTKFRQRFRMKKSTVQFLFLKLEPKIRSPTARNQAVDPMMKILMTLRFYAGAPKLMDAGDLIGIHKSTACHIIREVSHELTLLAPDFIKMPQHHEIARIREEYYTRAQFPRTVGFLDCTHIRIQSPGGNLAEVYRNRKGYFSLNVQTVASPDLKIMDIVARFPGSVHDQTIWNNSNIKGKLKAGQYGSSSLVVADGGYKNTLHVATALQTPTTEVQRLYKGMRMGLRKIQSVIVACAVLHNICIEFEGAEPEPPMDHEIPQVVFDDIDDPPGIQPQGNGLTVRDQLLLDYFPALLGSM